MNYDVFSCVKKTDKSTCAERKHESAPIGTTRLASGLDTLSVIDLNTPRPRLCVPRLLPETHHFSSLFVTQVNLSAL